jgi:hypothetical protein
MLLVGAIGTGKSYLACALARADGSYPKFLDRLARTPSLTASSTTPTASP